MLEYAVYMICPPERCAEILWRDEQQKAQAAEALKIAAHDLLELGVIDAIVPEPEGGAHTAPEKAVQGLREEISSFLEQCRRGVWTLDKRRGKIRRMGRWLSLES